jgi:hypothetical protein
MKPSQTCDHFGLDHLDIAQIEIFEMEQYWVDMGPGREFS